MFHPDPDDIVGVLESDKKMPGGGKELCLATSEKNVVTTLSGAVLRLVEAEIEKIAQEEDQTRRLVQLYIWADAVKSLNKHFAARNTKLSREMIPADSLPAGMKASDFNSEDSIIQDMLREHYAKTGSYEEEDEGDAAMVVYAEEILFRSLLTESVSTVEKDEFWTALCKYIKSRSERAKDGQAFMKSISRLREKNFQQLKLNLSPEQCNELLNVCIKDAVVEFAGYVGDVCLEHAKGVLNRELTPEEEKRFLFKYGANPLAGGLNIAWIGPIIKDPIFTRALTDLMNDMPLKGEEYIKSVAVLRAALLQYANYKGEDRLEYRNRDASDARVQQEYRIRTHLYDAPKTPGDFVMADEHTRRLRSMVDYIRDKLGDNKIELLEDRFVDGKTPREIASNRTISNKAMSNAITRACQQAQKAIHEHMKERGSSAEELFGRKRIKHAKD